MFYVIVSLLMVSAFANSCPLLAGSYTNCTALPETIFDSKSYDPTAIVDVFQIYSKNRIWSFDISDTSEILTDKIIADGLVSTRIEKVDGVNTPAFSKISIDTKNHCESDQLIIEETTSAFNGKIKVKGKATVVLDSNDNLVFETYYIDMDEPIQTVTCEKI